MVVRIEIVHSLVVTLGSLMGNFVAPLASDGNTFFTDFYRDAAAWRRVKRSIGDGLDRTEAATAAEIQADVTVVAV